MKYLASIPFFFLEELVLETSSGFAYHLTLKLLVCCNSSESVLYIISEKIGISS